MTQPPRIATWMLKHFGSGPDNQTLLGDLAEQYQQNGNAMWYWRQAMKAIPVSFFKEIRGHKWIAARALLTGWGMWIVGGNAIFRLTFLGITRDLGCDFGPGLPYDSGCQRLFTISAWNGWMPGHGPYHGLLWFRFNPLGFGVVFPLIVGAMCGWFIARRHRGQQTAVVLLFAGSVFLVDLLVYGPFIFTVGPYVGYAVFMPLAVDVGASLLGILPGGGLFFDKSNKVAVQD